MEVVKAAQEVAVEAEEAINHQNKVVTKKKIEDCYLYVGSSWQASNYNITAEFVINHIKKTFDWVNNVTEALRKLKTTNTTDWKPTLKAILVRDATEKATEEEKIEIKYKAELNDYLKRNRSYDNNIFTAYALIWER